MRSLALALIVIGSLALAAVLSLSIFLALKPRSVTTTYYYGLNQSTFDDDTPSPAAVVQNAKQSTILPSSSARPNRLSTLTTRRVTTEPISTTRIITTTTTTESSTTESTTTSTFTTTTESEKRPRFEFAGFLPSEWSSTERPIRTTTAWTTKYTTSFPLITARTQLNDRQRQGLLHGSGAVSYPLKLVQVRPQLVLPDSNGALVDSNLIMQNDRESDVKDPFLREPERLGKLVSMRQVDMKKYGKVVGLGYRSGRLYIPSHRSGNITVLETPSLRQVDEVSCPSCRIYDLDILSNGDLIVAQGARKKLSKIDGNGKKITAEITLAYSTKGVAVSSSDKIYVLSRSHETVYVYDTDLNQIDIIHFPNNNEDCNFLIVDSNTDQLLISCQQQVYVIGLNGQQSNSLRPRLTNAVTYSVGIQQDQGTGFILVARRGKSQIDVYGHDGLIRETLGWDTDALWSDMVVAEGYVYVVDYISTKITQYKY